ncbi:MAG: hypothetical protein LBS39_03810 [Campylobacteraceae bacterium]|nr:hypothetical protein [Campylobacteraceae bacterium]
MNTIFRHCEQSAAIHLFRHSREYGNPKTSDNTFSKLYSYDTFGNLKEVILPSNDKITYIYN